MKLEGLTSAKKIAKFLGTQEMIVDQLLEEGRLGGVMVANLRRRGIPITPRLKTTVELMVRHMSGSNAFLAKAPGNTLLTTEARGLFA